MISKTITIVNRFGVHARASAKLVTLASKFKSKILIERAGKKANAKSIMSVMMLAASKGTEIKVYADGPDEEEALKALIFLIQDRFGETD